MDSNTVVAMVALGNTIVGGIGGVCLRMIYNLRHETMRRLDGIAADVKQINGRVDQCEQDTAVCNEWRKGHASLVANCNRRFDELRNDIRRLG